MLEKRKAQGLPLRFIILAVLALVVIIVVISIYFQENENINDSLKSCGAKGGICVEKEKPGGERFCPYEKEISGVDCGAEKVCCAQI